MADVKYFALAAAAVFIYTACARDALANNVNATIATEKPALAGPTKAALVKLEKSAYAAWKSKDTKFWDTFLSDKFVGWGTSGKLDKVSAKKQYTGADCAIRSYVLSEERVSTRGEQAALITYKATVDGTCGGQKIPANSWAAGVYVRDGGQWKAAFHAQAAVVNPEVPPVKPVYQNGAPGDGKAKPTAPDVGTGSLLAIEGAVWEAWKDHDAKRLSDLLAEEMLSPTLGILTFKATADGTCFGQKVGPIWGSSIYVKYGDAWKWTFGINVPARVEGT